MKGVEQKRTRRKRKRPSSTERSSAQNPLEKTSQLLEMLVSLSCKSNVAKPSFNLK